jgi:hypothetical protein
VGISTAANDQIAPDLHHPVWAEDHLETHLFHSSWLPARLDVLTADPEGSSPAIVSLLFPVEVLPVLDLVQFWRKGTWDVAISFM